MRKLFWATIGVALISMVFAGCKKETTYTVRVTATEGGTVEGPNGEYKEGETVEFKAIPADGCVFMGWSDGSTDNPRTVTIGSENISLTALFFAPTVDLGLESGTLWATRNLGATVPWNYGDYYAWGETQTKDVYSWETYKYCKGSEETLTKYCNKADYGNNGFTDALTTLEAADDAATAAFGEGWAMPTNAEWEELYSQCYWVWTENYNNRNARGYIVYKAKSAGDKGTKVYSDGTPSASYSLTDAHIFLPAAGCRYDTNLNYAGSYGNYWSASLGEDGPHGVRGCDFYSSGVGSLDYGYGSRYIGFSIRPVKRP
ncbi:MAG: hypothetical protein J6X32_07580 [Salinivirgaceae bacterium]|nr:hypothetical protein [Salinivirgaceae bacterium]